MKMKLLLATGLMGLALLAAIVARQQPVSAEVPLPPAVRKNPPAPAPSPPVGGPFNMEVSLAAHLESASEKTDVIYEAQGAAAALAHAKSLEEIERENVVLHVMMMAAGQGGPEFVTRELAGCGLDETHKGFVISSLIANWPDSAAAIAWAQRELTGKLQRNAVSQAIQKLARVDPQHAITILEKLPPSEARDEAFGNLISGWGSHDFKGALAYARTSGGTSDFGSAMFTLSEKWVQQDPEFARTYLENTQQDEQSSRLAHLLVISKMKEDPAATLTWAASLSGPVGERAKRSAIIAWADEDVEAVTRFITTAAPPLRQQFAPILTAAWTKQDPAAAGAWARSLPAGELGQIIAPLIYHWNEMDAPAATVWLAALPDSPAKQHGNRILADRIAKKNGDNHLTDMTSEITTLLRNSLDDGMLFQKPIVCH